MRNTLGIPARGSNFFPRQAETGELWHLARRGNVLLRAPRRAGKTSLLHHLRDAPRAGWQCLLMDVEALDTEARFIAGLLAALYEAHPTGAWSTRFEAGVGAVLGNVGEVDVGSVPTHLARRIGDDWQDVGATALRVIGELGVETLVLVDEFPAFVLRLLDQPQGERRTRLFLDWFRQTRNRHGESDPRVHFVFSGSLGLDTLAQRIRMSAAIDDLATFRLGPLSDERADLFLARLGDGEGLALSGELRARIRGHLGRPIPYHLQLIFAELLNRVKFRRRELDAGLVDEAYAALLAAENRGRFQHWVDRLDDPLVPADERQLAKALLRAAAREPEGLDDTAIAEIRRQTASRLDAEPVLLILEHDGYLTRDGERWRFASSLLRDWWSKWQGTSA